MSIERMPFAVTRVQALAAQTRIKVDRKLGRTTPLNIVAASKADPAGAVPFDQGGYHLLVTMLPDDREATHSPTA